MLDLVIRNGLVVDGTGAPPVRADVAVRGDRIVEVRPDITDEATAVIDASGRVITPGFVDVHTHFDGQATWDELLEPSSPHGVTTLVMGNCGVGFAPVRPGDESWLMQLMEGVEEIPEVVLSEGVPWGWESFPQYLDLLASRKYSVDVGVHLAHGALRFYAMGMRGADNESSTPDDVKVMARLAAEAVEAGALGFSTSRTVGHTARSGSPVPGTFADRAELLGIGRSVAAAGGRVFEVAPSGIIHLDDDAVTAAELTWFEELAAATGINVSFICLQSNDAPRRWEGEMARAAALRQRGLGVYPLIAGRPFGVLYGWDNRNPFRFRRSYLEIEHLPFDERVAELSDSARRRAILDDDDLAPTPVESAFLRMSHTGLPLCFVVGDPPDYEPAPELSLGAIAEATGRTVLETAYDEMLANGGRTFLLRPYFNYTDGDHTALHAQLKDPDAIVAASDGGAHYTTICDASIPTYMLTHWARDRRRGPRFTLEEMVRRLTSQPAALYGLSDRGVVAPGLRADLNVVDFERLQLKAPRCVRDLPAGGRRLLQDAVGYDATIVAGTITRRDGVDTGARPGRLLRRS